MLLCRQVYGSREYSNSQHPLLCLSRSFNFTCGNVIACRCIKDEFAQHYEATAAFPVRLRRFEIVRWRKAENFNQLQSFSREFNWIFFNLSELFDAIQSHAEAIFHDFELFLNLEYRSGMR